MGNNRELEEIRRLATELIAEWKGSTQYTLKSFEEIDPGLGQRRNFRLRLTQDDLSALLTVYPEEDGLAVLASFLQIQELLARSHVRVPRIYALNEILRAVLLEDLGSYSLRCMLEDETGVTSSEKKKRLNQALEVLFHLQQIPVSEFPPPEVEDYLRGFRFFNRTFLDAVDASKDPRFVALEAAQQAISKAITSHPVVFSHFDFSAHNILITAHEELALIDFQDARPDSYVRDLLSLLYDRSFDELLGADLVHATQEAFRGDRYDRDLFDQHLQEYLFYWESRVAALFFRQWQATHDENFGKWQRDSMRRVQALTVDLKSIYPELEDVGEFIRELSSEVS